MEAIVVGVLSLIGTLCGVYFSNRKNNAIIAYRLEQLENKVNQHNNYSDKINKIEQRLCVLEDRINYIIEKGVN